MFWSTTWGCSFAEHPDVITKIIRVFYNQKSNNTGPTH